MENIKRLVCIPLAYQIVVDDVGWFNGWDDRCSDGPSRTGMPRKHVAEDYIALNELGKKINMKINCPLVLGEWDKGNLLRGMKHATNDEKGWDMASQIDMDIAEKCFEAAENSEYIEYAYHGVMHGYWTDGRHVADKEFYIPADDGCKTRYSDNLIPVSEEYFESHLETFFKIYESWGFKKKIRSFTSPGGVHGSVNDNLKFADILRKNNIIYWADMWNEIREMSCVLNGVIYLNNSREALSIPWNAYDVDPAILPDYDKTLFDGEAAEERTVYPAHWPNFLRYNPMENLEKIDAWAKYFKRQGEVFGVMLSRDIAFAGSQALYCKYTKVTYGENKVILDFSDVDDKNAIGKTDTMYISIRGGLLPKECVGGRISQYETHNCFKTYKIERLGKTVEILF